MAVESVEIVLNGVDNATPVMDKVTQKLVDNEGKYISKLKEQLIALEQGAEAAERFKLSEMGFSEETINAAIALKQQIEASKEAAQAADELAKQTEKAAQAQQEIQSKPGLGESASEFADSLGKGVERAKGIAEATKPIVEFITNSAGWQMKMNSLMEQHQKQVDFNIKKQKEQLDVQIQIANVQNDRKVREEMLKTIEADVAAKLKEKQELVSSMRKIQEDFQNSYAGRFAEFAETFTGGLYNNDEDKQIAANILLEEEKRLEALKQQKEQLDEQLKTENEQVRLAREKAEAEQRRADNAKTAEEELNKLRNEIRELKDPGENERRRISEMFDAEGVTEAQRMELENLRAIKLEEEEIARQKKEAAEQNKKAIEDERKALQDRWQEFSKNLLAQDKEREDQKKMLAKQQQEEEKKRKEAFAQPTAPLQAMQSRLLSRVNSSGGDRVAKASEKTAELTEQIEKLQREQLDLQKRRGITELAVVEG